MPVKVHCCLVVPVAFTCYLVKKIFRKTLLSNAWVERFKDYFFGLPQAVFAVIYARASQIFLRATPFNLSKFFAALQCFFTIKFKNVNQEQKEN